MKQRRTVYFGSTTPPKRINMGMIAALAGMGIMAYIFFKNPEAGLGRAG